MSTEPAEGIRQALQQLLNADPDGGWMVTHWVTMMGLQRVDADGQLHNTAWVFSPPEQPDYVTDGLIRAAEDMRAGADVDDD